MLRIFERIMLALLIPLAVPVGAVAGVFAFLFSARFASSVPVLTVIGAVAVLVVSGGQTWLAARQLYPAGRPARRRLPMVVAGGALLLSGLASWALIFTPMEVTWHPADPSPEARSWDLPTGSRIAWILTPAAEPTGRPPVLMLHGGPGASPPLRSGRTSRRLADAGFDVYNYHQMGSGLSSRLDDPSGYTVERQVADLEAIRQEIGAERMILVGGSWGGTLAAHYIAEHPDRVESAIFASPGAIWATESGEPVEGAGSDGSETDIITDAVTPRFAVVYHLLRINPKAAIALASDEEMSGFMQPLIGQIIASDVAGCGIAAGGEGVAGGGGPPTPTAEVSIPRGFGFYANMITAASVARTPDPRPALREVDIPVLILRGECDRMRWEVAREYEEVFRSSELVVIEGAAHDVAGAPSYPEILADWLG